MQKIYDTAENNPSVTITNETPHDLSIKLKFGYHAIMKSRKHSHRTFFACSKALGHTIKAGNLHTFNSTELQQKISQPEYASLSAIHSISLHDNELLKHSMIIPKDLRNSRHISIHAGNEGQFICKEDTELKNSVISH